LSAPLPQASRIWRNRDLLIQLFPTFIFFRRFYIGQELVHLSSEPLSLPGNRRDPADRAVETEGHYTALAITSRIGDIERFKRPDSLANYFGLTPGCRNSGEATQRLGSITKQGSKMVRYLLGQAVIKVLRFDGVMRAWFKRIKKRRGAKIARVAVMRANATLTAAGGGSRQGIARRRAARSRL
jgi:hypothetical protein